MAENVHITPSFIRISTPLSITITFTSSTQFVASNFLDIILTKERRRLLRSRVYTSNRSARPFFARDQFGRDLFYGKDVNDKFCSWMIETANDSNLLLTLGAVRLQFIFTYCLKIGIAIKALMRRRPSIGRHCRTNSINQQH